MTYQFSKSSLEKLATCHPDLQVVLHEAIKLSDFTILDGHRGEMEQNAAFAAGKSKLKFPDSKHNSLPSNAVDIAPVPLDWGNFARFAYLAGVVMALAHTRNIKMRWGGDWDADGEISDNKFNDLPHFELL